MTQRKKRAVTAPRRKVAAVPVSQIPAAERLEMEKHGVFINLDPKELKAKKEAWLRSLRWPLHGVDTETFASLPEDQRLRDLADGFLQSATSLCIELGEHPERLTWPRGSTVFYLHHLAVEVFLKACLVHAGRRVPTHEISELQDVFAEVFPEEECPPLETMWDFNAVEMAELGLNPGDETIPSRTDETYRYFADRQGQPPKGFFCFSPATLIGELERLAKDFERVWKAVTKDEALNARAGPKRRASS